MYRLACVVTVLLVASVASASPPTLQDLFAADPHGCAAAEAGQLDLKATLRPGQAKRLTSASGPVSGFASGQVLTLVLASQSDEAGHRQHVALAAMTPTHTTVLLELDHETRANTLSSEEVVTFTMPPDGQGWALFTSNSWTGTGIYSVSVRCAPRPAATS